jgi:hypothetical protein
LELSEEPKGHGNKFIAKRKWKHYRAGGFGHGVGLARKERRISETKRKEARYARATERR